MLNCARCGHARIAGQRTRLKFIENRIAEQRPPVAGNRRQRIDFGAGPYERIACVGRKLRGAGIVGTGHATREERHGSEEG